MAILLVDSVCTSVSQHTCSSSCNIIWGFNNGQKFAVLALQNEKLIVDEFLDKVAAASRGVSHMLYECIKHLLVAFTWIPPQLGLLLAVLVFCLLPLLLYYGCDIENETLLYAICVHAGCCCCKSLLLSGSVALQ